MTEERTKRNTRSTTSKRAIQSIAEKGAVQFTTEKRATQNTVEQKSVQSSGDERVMRQTVVDAILQQHTYPGPWWMLSAYDCIYFSTDPDSDGNLRVVRRLVDTYIRFGRETPTADTLWTEEQQLLIDYITGSFGVADEKAGEELKVRLDKAIAKRNRSSRGDPSLDQSIDQSLGHMDALNTYWRERDADAELERQLVEITKEVTDKCRREGGTWRFWCMNTKRELIDLAEDKARARIEEFVDKYRQTSSIEEENRLISEMMFSDQRIKFVATTPMPEFDRVFWRYAELLKYLRPAGLGHDRDRRRKWESPI